MTDAPASQPTPKEPSLIGCLIPITAVVTLLGLGTCVVVTGVVQNRQISGFTQDTALEIVPTEPSPDTAAKLEALRGAADAQTATQVSFSVVDLNSLIATQPMLEPYRLTTQVISISPTGMVIRSSQEMRKLGKGQRFLNGDFVFTVVPSETNHWQLMLQDIKVPESDVPEGFVGMFRGLHMFRFGLENQELQAVLKQITEIRLEEGQVVVVTKGDVPPPAS